MASPRKWVHTAALGLGLALAVGVPTLACSGMEAGASDISGAMAGNTYAVQPSPEALRTLKILNAAVNGKPPPKNLQPLNDEEKALYKSGKSASGSEKQAIANSLKLMMNARVSFESGGRGEYTFDGGKNPFDWKVTNATATSGNLELAYDKGNVEKGSLTLNGSNLDVHMTSPQTLDLVFKKK